MPRIAAQRAAVSRSPRTGDGEGPRKPHSRPDGWSLEVVRLLPIGKAAMAMVRTMTPASEVRRVNQAPAPADLLPG
jgi:hypothetical protein